MTPLEQTDTKRTRHEFQQLTQEFNRWKVYAEQSKGCLLLAQALMSML